MAAAPETIKLHLPDGMSYTCHNEGICCRVFETIPVDENAADSMAQLDPGILNRLAGNPEDAAVEIPSEPAGAGQSTIARKLCGDCSMLTADKRCAIHSLAGEVAKPRVCQDFPWRYVRTPGGVYVGLSFVCPSVRANRGQPVNEQANMLEVHYQTSASIRSTPEAIPLNARVTLSWNDYIEIESALVELLSMEEPLPVRLIACCLIPGFVDQMLAQAAAQFAAPGSAATDATKTAKDSSAPHANNLITGTPPAELIPKIIKAIRANNYRHVLRIAKKETPTNYRSRRMFLGMFTSFANTLHRRKEGRLATVAGVMTQYIRHALGMGKVLLQPIEANLSHAQLDLATVPDSGYAADQIARYVSHCIFRKDLALTGDLTRRVRLLALNAALIPWYAYAIAAEKGSGGGAGFSVPREKDWGEAIGQVERLYGFHSAFYRFFEQNKAFSDIVDSFILKPGYPYTLFRQVAVRECEVMND